MAHAQHAARGLAAYREGFRQQIVHRLALGQTLFELVGFSCQGLVGQRFQALFQSIDTHHRLAELLQEPVIAVAEYF